MKQAGRSLKVLASTSDNIKKGDLFKVNPQLIHEEDGFNLRDYEDEDVKNHIEEFAQAYTNGKFVPPLLVRVDNGKIIVVEGHCRRRGALLAMERGVEQLYVQCIQFNGSDTERIQVMLSSAEGLRLKPIEVAQGYLRLNRMGLDTKDIANLVGKTHVHVEQMLLLATSNYDVQKLVSDGSVSATLAIETIRDKGDSAGEYLQSNLDKVQKIGKKTLTKKDIYTGPSKKELNELYAPLAALYEKRISEDQSLLNKSEEELQNLTVTLPAAEYSKILNILRRISDKDSCHNTNNETNITDELDSGNQFNVTDELDSGNQTNFTDEIASGDEVIDF